MQSHMAPVWNGGPVVSGGQGAVQSQLPHQSQVARVSVVARYCEAGPVQSGEALLAFSSLAGGHAVQSEVGTCLSYSLGTCLLLSFCGISALASLCEAGPVQNAVEAQVARVCFLVSAVSQLLLHYARRGLCRMPWRPRWHVSASFFFFIRCLRSCLIMRGGACAECRGG